MFNQTFKTAFGEGGLKAALISLLFYVILVVVWTIALGGMLFAVLSQGVAGLSQVSTGSILIIFVLGILTIVLGIMVGAGLLGSFKDAIEGRTVTMGSFWHNSKIYALRYLGYGLLYGLIMVVIAVILVSIPTYIFGHGAVVEVLQVISIVLSSVCFMPMMILSIVKYERSGFITNNLKPLLIWSVVLGVLGLVPGVNILVALAQIFYPLFILSLYQGNDVDANPKDLSI